MTPTTYCYLDYMQGDVSTEMPVYSTLRLKTAYDWNPVPAGVDSTLILGGQGNLWTEQVPNPRQVEYMTYPRAWALAETYWSPQSKKDWNGFTRRVETHFARANQAGINYSRSMLDPVVKVRKNNAGNLMVELGTEIGGLDIFYTTDNSFPDELSANYAKPIELPHNTQMIRMITYREGKPVGQMMAITTEDLLERAKK